MILIVGDSNDIHISSVCNLLIKPEQVININPHNAIDSIKYSFLPFEISFYKEGNEYSANEIEAIWWRLKPKLSNNTLELKEAESIQFMLREWLFVLESLSNFLADSFWINKRSIDKEVRNKPNQLLTASKLGFTIPKTCITNNPTKLFSFFKEREYIIYKPLGYLIIPPDEVLYANKIEVSELKKMSDHISVAPGIFQEYIHKAFELRITIVENEIFAVKINSQATSNTMVDWRRDQNSASYELFDLDNSFKHRLLALHHAFGLVFGAYDFIVTPSNEYFFLEVNQVGQWLWMEEKLEDLKITQAMANVLSRYQK
jgi:glutathione synthase/RimK-type ligase-like ATP-grasp enzyme